MEAYRNLITQLNNSVEEVRKSIYGTEIVNPIKFCKGRYRKTYSNIKPKFLKENEYYRNTDSLPGVYVGMEDFWLPPTALVDFKRGKDIIKTFNLSGDVTKEIYGLDDWQIQIRMTCIMEKDRTAQETLEKVIEWADLRDSIEVEGSIFSSKKIHCIAIESIDIQTITGSPNTIPIVLNCVSDPSKESLLSNLSDFY